MVLGISSGYESLGTYGDQSGGSICTAVLVLAVAFVLSEVLTVPGGLDAAIRK